MDIITHMLYLQQIFLSWSTFLLEGTDDCSYDSVEVFDGPDSNSASLGFFCDRHLPPAITSSSNMLTIRKLTDGSQSDKGFQLNYKQFGER